MAEKQADRGRQENQKMKAYMIMRILQKNTNYDNLLKTSDIVDKLKILGISAQEKSVQRDIKAINEILELESVVMDDIMEDLLDDEDPTYTIQQAQEHLQKEKEECSIVFRSASTSKRGYYFKRQDGYFEEIRLLMESVNASKFISKSSAEYLKRLILKDVCKQDIEQLDHISPVVDRTKTNNKKVFDNVKTLSDAIKSRCKVQFNYISYYLPEGEKKPKARDGRKGDKYIVSPYHLLINDGNYYLICFDEKNQKKWTYRIDRMKNVDLLQDQKREGAEHFYDFDANKYVKTNFAMFDGDNRSITIKFDNRCMNAVMEKLGTEDVIYKRFDSKYFTVNMITGVNEQFYGWLCTFGNKAKVVAPQEQVDAFQEYVNKITSLYE